MTDPGQLNALRQTALDHARAGRLDDAAGVLRKVLLDAPGDLGSLLLLGDVSHDAGRTQEATRAYTAALNAAGAYGAPLPGAIQAGLSRAQARLTEYAGSYEEHLEAVVPAARRSPRFAQSVDILTGKSSIYLQQPTRYYFPGLPQIEIYDNAGFDWVAGLEAKTPRIQAELKQVLADHAAFRPYLERDETQLHVRSHELLDNDDWGAFYLWKDGRRIEENCARCPVTAAAFDNIPLDFADGKSPSVLFSLLKPGAHIPPHHGLVNTRLICHLPLLVPGPAWLRVGSKVHHWQEGKVVIFDDTIEHEAKNESDRTRVVLLFDIWRPELTEQERREVSALLGSITRLANTPGG